MRKIEDKSSRQVTFSKRRNGLMKKARELSVLCDVDVGLLIYSNRGKQYDFCSTNSLTTMLERYREHLEEEAKASCEAENYNSEYSNLQSSAELLQIVERSLDEPNVDQLSVNELVQLEKQLNDALTQTRSRQTQVMIESISTLQEKEKMLREENEALQGQIAAAMENNGAKEGKEVEFGIASETGGNFPTLRLLL